MEMQKLNLALNSLLDYAEKTGLIEAEDRLLCANLILGLVGLPYYEKTEGLYNLDDSLQILLDFAAEQGLIGDTVTERDLFDTAIMGLLTPRSSQVNQTFRELYEKDPVEATDWYYQFSQDTNYIRRSRIKKDVKWQSVTPYGNLDITINLSKPEKDPKLIAQAARTADTSYPKCQLCMENVGYAGRVDHPARQNHRVIPIRIAGEDWGFQYSPYVYYNEHCIVFNQAHVPMKIDRDVFVKLNDFVTEFPHYFVGSNADLPIVGGSILSHEHFQGGHYRFAMEDAKPEHDYFFEDYPDLTVSTVKWPMSVIRVSGEDRRAVTKLSDKILRAWRIYDDPSQEIYSFTEDVPHNTITPIARRRDGKYEMDLVLRNNRTSEAYPDGIFHPHPEKHHIKKENIGLIEVMGLAVLPARLKDELEGVAQALFRQEEHLDESLKVHEDWYQNTLRAYQPASLDIAREIVRDETGKVFLEVLEDAGVFKRDQKGQKAFQAFMNSLGAVLEERV